MCELCESFSKFYYNDRENLLEEAVAAQILLKNTDTKRLDKAKYHVKRTRNITKVIEKKEITLSRIEWNNRSDVSTEGRNHAGWVEWDDTDPKKTVYGLWCDCQDFFFRLQYTYNKQNMSPWDGGKGFENRNKLRAKAGGFEAHNKQPQKFSWTNKDQVQFLCKHLACIVFYYILGELNDSDQARVEIDKAKQEKIAKEKSSKEVTKNLKEPSKETPKKSEKVSKEPVKPSKKPVEPVKAFKASPESKKSVKPVKEPSKEIKKVSKEPIKKETPKKEPVKIVKEPLKSKENVKEKEVEKPKAFKGSPKAVEDKEKKEQEKPKAFKNSPKSKESIEKKEEK